MELIKGKQIAKDIKLDVRKELVESGITPGLAVLLIGNDEASHLYVKLKEKACKQVGIDFHKYTMEANVSEQEVLDAINFLNKDETIDAILVQLPLPEGIDEQKVIDAIDPKKDVDGFHPQTLKAYLSGESDFMPGLTSGIYRLIESTKEKLEGKQAVVIANSDIFSQPLVKLLSDKGMHVEAKHPDDDDLKTRTKEADILIIAIGRKNFINGDMIKEGAILIDVGTNKEGKTVVGDINAEDVEDKAAFLTPVPGGVGPITVAMLLENTLRLAQQ